MRFGITLALNRVPEIYLDAALASDRIDTLEIPIAPFLTRLDKSLGNLLERLRSRKTLSAHGYALGLLDPQPWTEETLKPYQRCLSNGVFSAWSDHYAITTWMGKYLGSLTTAPTCDSAIQMISQRLKQACELVPSLPFFLENPSVPFLIGDQHQLTLEPLRKITFPSNAGVLLDVSNLVCNELNFGISPEAELEQLKGVRVGEVHLAGGYWNKEKIFSSTRTRRRSKSAPGSSWSAPGIFWMTMRWSSSSARSTTRRLQTSKRRFGLPNEFSAFEKALFETLGSATNPGAKNQLVRFRADRREILALTFKEIARDYGRERFDLLIDRFLDSQLPASDDTGFWGEFAEFLNWLSLLPEVPALTKTQFYAFAAGFAAQQLETAASADIDSVPYLRKYLNCFALRGRTIALSSWGYGESAFGSSGPIAISAKEGVIRFDEFGYSSPARLYSEGLKKAMTSARRKGWRIPSELRSFWKARAKIPSFFGFSRFECRVFQVWAERESQDTELKTLLSKSAVRFIYPVWAPGGAETWLGLDSTQPIWEGNELLRDLAAAQLSPHAVALGLDSRSSLLGPKQRR